ncbi:hypothetical protein JTB14_033731 [Gonioctena quinquepunctata]|nr:hypothetical protein JTB14_033731 [Gonioctena quinquepunctata]
MSHYLKHEAGPEYHTKTLEVPATEQKDGESNIFLKQRVGKSYRWLLKLSFTSQGKGIVNELCHFLNRRGTEIKKGGRKISRQSGVSNDQALPLMTDANLSIHQYDIIRKESKEINMEMYPPYLKVKAAKQLC